MVGYPLDTVKVKIQTQDPSKGGQVYRGTFDCLRQLVRSQGVSGLYRGMTSPLTGVAAINAICFGVYGNVKKIIPNPDSILSCSLGGATAGLVQVGRYWSVVNITFKFCVPYSGLKLVEDYIAIVMVHPFSVFLGVPAFLLPNCNHSGIPSHIHKHYPSIIIFHLSKAGSNL